MTLTCRPIALLGALLSALWGCSYAMSTLQEPRTLAPGKVRVTAQARIGQGSGPHNVPAVRPATDLGLNVGLPARLELQLAGSTSPGGRLGIKALLVDWPSLTLAVVPTYQVQEMSEDFDSLLDEEFHPQYLVQTLIAPVIVGLPLGPSTDALLGVDVHVGRRKASGSDRDQSGPVLAFGAHVGLAVRGPGGRGAVIPQCGVLVSALDAPFHQVNEYEDYTYDALRRGSLRWECALGFTVGARQVARSN